MIEVSVKKEDNQSRSNAVFAAGYTFQKEGQFRKAVGAYQEAIRLDPNNLKAHNNLGNCLRSMGFFKESLIHYAKVLEVEPGRGSTLLNQSLAYLALNEYEKAWPGYECRLNSIGYRKEVLSSGKTKWQGQPLKKGERLYIYTNQGIGDEIQMLRYLPIISQQVDHIIFEVHEAVYGLVKDIPFLSEVRIRPKKSKELPEFDYYCEIFSLPGLLQTRFDRVPVCYRPPFTPDRNILSILAEEKKRYPDHKHIGIVWSGNPKNDMNPFRACGLVHFLPLLNLPGYRFYSLQKGLPTKDLQTYADESRGVVDLAEHLVDMASTATAIDELDLLITTDTSVPHLAGTLGAKSWVLLHQPADWRWTVDCEVTPWYPQLRLWRQDRPHTWIGLIDRIKAELEKGII